MTLTTDNPGLKLGKLAPVRPAGLKTMSAYGTLPTPPATWYGPNSASYDWLMLGNGPDPSLTLNGGQPVGDCAFAGFVHGNAAVSLLENTTPPDIDANSTVGGYLIYDDGQDVGCALADVLHRLYTTGLLTVDAAGYAPLDGGLTELLSAIYLLGWGYIGIQCPQSMQEQFADRQLIDYVPGSPILGGHCIVPVAFDQAARIVDVITWGQRVKCTFTFLDQCMDEAWGVIVKQIATAGALDGIDFAALTHDLDALPGHVG